MKNTDPRHIAIIGMGAMGVAAFIASVRHHAAKEITLIDPKPPGQGIIYNCSDNDLLCNTSVDLMSVLPVECDDLLKYLHAQGHTRILSKDFIPRRLAGQYVQDRFGSYLKIAADHGIKVRHLFDNAVRVKRNAGKRYEIETSSGSIDKISDVIICNGYTTPRIPDVISQFVSDPSICISPYPEKDLIRRMAPYRHVLVLGSKLLAVDATLILCRENHKVTMASPSGDLPAVRNHLVRSNESLVDFAKTAASAIDYKNGNVEHQLVDLVLNTIHQTSTDPLDKQIAREKDTTTLLRKEIALAEKNKGLV